MLPPAALADLARSGISQADADAAGIFYTADASEIYPDFDAEPALVIPYWQASGEIATYFLDGETKPFCRVRYLNPKRKGGTFTASKEQRYGQPKASGSHAYFPPGPDWPRILADVQEPILVTEGEKKALAGAAAGFPVIALGGVWNYSTGHGGETLMPELAEARWPNRDTFIVFDSDAATNSGILTAEARLSDMLMRERGARVYIVRLPPGADGSKMGLDDFLLAYGPDGLRALLEASVPLGGLDAKVISLNAQVAWIDSDGMIWDRKHREFMRKDNFVVGSRFSTLKHQTVGGSQRAKSKEISVAQTWLTHPHAARYARMLFRPGMADVVPDNKGLPCLNSWVDFAFERGVTADDLRVASFLKLSRFMFQNMEEADRDLPLKMMAYKAQNPMSKLGLCLVLIGDQGSGKTLWGETMCQVFAPYSKSLQSKSFGAEFQGWMEKTLFALVNEASPEHLQTYGDQLKSLITDTDRDMNEKYMVAKEVQSYTVYMLTANKRAVGSFSYDDRRMVVIDCPKPDFGDEMQALYRYLGKESMEWSDAGGPKALLGYLIEYDLKGWRPPPKAPASREKYMAYIEGLTSVQQLARDMITSDENSVEKWLRANETWCQTVLRGNNAQQINAATGSLEAMKHWQIRPWYEPRELALMFPHVMETLLGSKLDKGAPIGRISRELRDNGIPYLRPKDNPEGFMWQGVRRMYLVITDFDEWKEPLSQNDFERLMKQWPEFGKRAPR